MRSLRRDVWLLALVACTPGSLTGQLAEGDQSRDCGIHSRDIKSSGNFTALTRRLFATEHSRSGETRSARSRMPMVDVHFSNKVIQNFAWDLSPGP